MMNSHLKTLIFIFILVYSGCTFSGKPETTSFRPKEIQKNVEFLHIPKTGEDTLMTSIFADTVLYIPLETKQETFLKRIHSIWIGDEGILISDIHKLLLFSMDGKFIRRIGKTGSGPGEHQLIFNFDVYDDTVFLSSSGKRSLIKYTLDGKFCDEIPFDGQPVYFNRTENGKFVWYQSEEGKIYVHNDNLSNADTIVVEYDVTLGRYRYVHMERFMNFLQKSPNGLLFNSFKSDTIWNIGIDGKRTAFIMDLKENLLPYEKQIEFSEGDFTRWEKTARPYQMAHVLPFESWLFIFRKHYYGEEYSGIFLQNRFTHELTGYQVPFIFDDLIGYQPLGNIIFTSSQQYLVSEISPLELNLIGKVASSAWLNRIKAIKKDDNPILVLMKIKN